MKIIQTKSFKLATYIRGDEKSPRLVIVLPGRLDTKDYLHMRNHVDYFAQKGFLALSFDPPGTWESPGSIEIYTITNYIKAVNELIAYFGNRPTVLMGHSRGGTIAMLVGASNKNATHIISVMSYPGPSNIDEDTKQNGFHESQRDMPFDKNQERKVFRLPLSYFEDGLLYDASNDLKKSDKPKLFILGTKDDVVKPEHVREAYAMSAKPKTLYELNSDHDYRHHKNLIDEVNEVVGEFLDES